MEIRVKRVMLDDDELMHYRTKGSKNGVRQYQYKDGSLTPLGRIHYGIGKARGDGDSDETSKKRSLGQVMKDRKTAKRRAESLEKARAAKAAKSEAAKKVAEEEAKKKAEEEKAKQEHEEARQKAMKSGSATEVLKFQGEFTDAERREIKARLDWEVEMGKLSAKETAEGKSKVDKIFDKADVWTKRAEKGIKFYNTVANVTNAFNGEKVMPKIETNIQNGNKDQVKKYLNDKKKAEEAESKRKQQEAEGPAKREERAKKKKEKENQQQQNQSNNKKTDNNSKDNKNTDNGQNATDTSTEKKNKGSIFGKNKNDKSAKDTADKVTKSDTKINEVSKDVIDAGYAWMYSNSGEFLGTSYYRDIEHADLDEEYLAHYGVKGMKWGVRRATKKLTNATTDDQRSKAVDSLYKHRAKATAEIEKLKGQRLKLDADYAKSSVKNAEKAAKLETKVGELDGKIAKNEKKANRFYTSYDKASELLEDNISLQNKSDKLNAKAEKLKGKHDQIKAKIETNEAKIKAFEQGIKDIESTLLDEGKRRVDKIIDNYDSIYQDKKYVKGLRKIDSDYKKKIQSAKTLDEMELNELEWDEAREKFEEKYFK